MEEEATAPVRHAHNTRFLLVLLLLDIMEDSYGEGGCFTPAGGATHCIAMILPKDIVTV